MGEAADLETILAWRRYGRRAPHRQRVETREKLRQRNRRRAAARCAPRRDPALLLGDDAPVELGEIAVDRRGAGIARVDRLGADAAGRKIELDEVHIGVAVLLIGGEHLGPRAIDDLALAFQDSIAQLRIAGGEGRIGPALRVACRRRGERADAAAEYRTKE